MRITVLEQRPRQDRAIFTDPRRYATFGQASMKRHPFLDTFRMIKDAYAVRSVLDMGCGLGRSVLEWEQVVEEAYGCDGSEASLEYLRFDKARFHVVDLRVPVRIEGIDCIHCQEVAEHVQFEHSETLVRNIVRNSRVSYFTAAPPGQIGSGHVNCQYQEFWVALFRKLDWALDETITAFNRKHAPSQLERANAFVVSGEKRPLLH